MIRFKDLRWQKAYVGPFGKKLAIELVNDLKKVMDPEKNAIWGARIRKRRMQKLFDVYIQTIK